MTLFAILAAGTVASFIALAVYAIRGNADKDGYATTVAILVVVMIVLGAGALGALMGA
jgi:hypothetical protein